MNQYSKRIPAHPGEVLSFEFLEPLTLTIKDLAKHLNLPANRIASIVEGRSMVSATEAWMLSGALGTTPEFWLNLQVNHHLARTKPKRKVKRVRVLGRPGEEGGKR